MSASVSLLALIGVCVCACVCADTVSGRLLHSKSWDLEFIVSLAINPITGTDNNTRLAIQFESGVESVFTCFFFSQVFLVKIN